MPLPRSPLRVKSEIESLLYFLLHNGCVEQRVRIPGSFITARLRRRAGWSKEAQEAVGKRHASPLNAIDIAFVLYTAFIGTTTVAAEKNPSPNLFLLLVWH